MDGVNHQVRLAARPEGEPKPTDWAFTEEPVPTPDEGELVVRVTHVSIDPTMRGWMNDQPSYLPPVGLNDVMRAIALGTVVESKNPDHAPGDVVTGMLGVQEYALSGADGLTKVDPSTAPPLVLSALGLTGMTAYFGLLDVGALKEGETVLVSGAAGATGSMVGQIAKLKGARVVGIAGGPAKCARLTEEFGFDAAVDYRAGRVDEELARLTPDGVDVFFDNVGGEILDAGLARLAMRGRVVLCGAISQYNNRSSITGPGNYLNLLFKRGRMEGFIILDYADRIPDAAAEMAGWLAEGRIRSAEDVVEGSVADFPDTLLALFRGTNNGKLILKIA